MTRPPVCGCYPGVVCRSCQKRGRSAAKPAPVSLPCVHEGDILRPCESCRGEANRVRECDILGETTRDDCRACEFRVPDDSLIDPAPRGGRRLVLTLDTDGADYYRATRPTHERYAARLGADHVVLTGRAGWSHVLHEKWRYRKYVAAYDRTLVLDTDTWVSPAAPDIFGVVPETHVGMCRTDPYLIPAFDWRAELRALCRSQEVPVPAGAAAAYFNCGVWVGSKAHADYWRHPPRPGRLPGKWCDEEQWGRVQCARLGFPVFDYGRRWNHQWYLDRDFAVAAADRPHIVHLSGMPQAGAGEWRVRLFNLLAAGFPPH